MAPKKCVETITLFFFYFFIFIYFYQKTEKCQKLFFIILKMLLLYCICYELLHILYKLTTKMSPVEKEDDKLSCAQRILLMMIIGGWIIFASITKEFEKWRKRR